MKLQLLVPGQFWIDKFFKYHYALTQETLNNGLENNIYNKNDITQPNEFYQNCINNTWKKVNNSNTIMLLKSFIKD